MTIAAVRRPYRYLFLFIFGFVGLSFAPGTLPLAAPGTTGAEADPQRNSDVYGYTVSELVADTLVLFENGDYVPALAESWEVGDEGKSYTFKLREGVTFHNGEPLSAEAVKFSLERVMNPDDPLPAAGQLGDVASAEVVDEQTVRLKLERLNPDFLLNLTGIWIVEPGSAAEDEFPVGTGPFSITKYQPDQQIVLEKYPDYWGGEPVLDTVTVRNIPDPGTLVLELEAGTVDLIMFAPPREVARLEEGGFAGLEFSAVNTAFIALNNKTVDDVNLRKAICYAVDRDVLLTTAYAGLGKPELTIALQDGWAFNDEVAGYSFDPEQAQTLLDEAGYTDSDGDGIREKDGQPLTLNFQARGDGEWLLATQIVQQFLGDVGIGTNITTAERSTYYGNVRTGAYDLGWWIDNAQPEPPIYEYAFHSDEYWNVTQQPRPEVDALIEQGRSTLDQEERAEAYRELQRVVFDEAIQCPQFWIDQVHLAAPEVSGLEVSSLGVLYNAQSWRKNP